MFVIKNTQKIYHFLSRNDTLNVAAIDYALFVRVTFRVKKASKLKGPGLFAFIKEMPVILL